MFNPAIIAAGAAASASKQTARQALLGDLVKARAFEPSSAIPIAAEGPTREALTEQIGLAVIRPVGDGRYYLDRERQKDQYGQAGWILLAILIAGASILASGVALVAAQ